MTDSEIILKDHKHYTRGYDQGAQVESKKILRTVMNDLLAKHKQANGDHKFYYLAAEVVRKQLENL